MTTAGNATLKIEETVFCFIDVETTGLSPYFGDRICEVALLQWKNGRALKQFHSLVNPQRPILPDASAVNGITDEMVKDAPRFADIAPQILSVTNGAVLVAHNAPFDLGFFTAQLADQRLPFLTNQALCTLALARRFYSFTSYGLGAIARSLGLPVQLEHRAQADVLVTQQVFAHFLKDFFKNGVATVRDLLDLQGGSIRHFPPLPPVLPSVLEQAIRHKEWLLIRYLDLEGQISEQVVEPLFAFTHNGRSYLGVYCFWKRAFQPILLNRVAVLKRYPHHQ